MFKSGFLSESLVLDDRPLGDHTQTSFVIGSDLRFLRNFSNMVAPIPGTQLAIDPIVMELGVTSLMHIGPTSPNGP